MLELTEAPRSYDRAEGIPEGFHSTKPGRVAPKARERLSLGGPSWQLSRRFVDSQSLAVIPSTVL